MLQIGILLFTQTRCQTILLVLHYPSLLGPFGVGRFPDSTMIASPRFIVQPEAPAAVPLLIVLFLLV